MKPIPIAAAKLLALDYGYDQVIIIGRSVGDGPEHGEHLTTYGKDKANCEVAARAGEFLKFKVMGWAATSPVPAERAGDACNDCDEAARLANSDATTPGFFSNKCAKHRAGDAVCPRCGGTKQIKIEDSRTPHFPRPTKCPDCHGTGRVSK